MSYLSLHKLELTGDPFAVARIIDEDQQASPECQLPDFTPLDLDLPPLDIEMPPLDCKFDVDTPLIPLPFFEGCIPDFSGSITISSCNDDMTVDVITPISITKIADCEYQLDGDIELCVVVPCPDGISVSGTATIGATGPGISGSGTISISGTGCDAVLSGDVTITSTIACPGGIEIEAAADVTASGVASFLGYTITVAPELSLDAAELGGGCGYSVALSGTIGLSLSGSGPVVKSMTVCTAEGPETIDIYTAPP